MSIEAEQLDRSNFVEDNDFDEESHDEVSATSGELAFLMDVPMNVSVELGRGEITLRELLQVGQATVLELDKLAGEPLEMLVNKQLVAKGEVVVINEKYGIRLTDIIDPIANGKDSVQV